MRKLCLLGVALAIAGTASAAPNVTNVTQKGSLLIWPDIRVDNGTGRTAPGVPGWNTLVRLQNDSNLAINVKCYWMDGNKNRVNFLFVITREQPVWFDAGTGSGSINVNAFPLGNANGLDNPFLIGKGFTSETNDNDGPYHEGELVCFAVDSNGANQVRANHLSGTATVWHSQGGSYEYNAYAFFANNVAGEALPVGTGGVISLNGATGAADGYDQCGLYQIGQFTPAFDPSLPTFPAGPFQGDDVVAPRIYGNRLAISGCTQDLRQDYTPTYTKLQFTVWNEDEVGFTGAYECANSWHETNFDAAIEDDGGVFDSAAQNFSQAVLKTYAARYRVQGVASTVSECVPAVPAAQVKAVGVLGVQSSFRVVPFGPGDVVGTTLANAGKFSGEILWDRTVTPGGTAPGGTTPEGGIR